MQEATNLRNLLSVLESSSPEEMQSYSLEAIKYCLKNYHRLTSALYPQSQAVKQQHLTEENPVDALCFKADIDRAIATLPANLRKIIILHHVIDLSVNKICNMLAMRFRIDLYRKLDEAYRLIYAELGIEWLSKILNDYKEDA